MSLVAHKYTPAEMSSHELESTFAAREQTVDFLLQSLRDQITTKTLSSFVITGPRGAGKSTIIHMTALRIRQDPILSAAWITVVFPEEQFNITSLRDLLASTLASLAKQQIAKAAEWTEKVEAESNEEQSEQLAVTGLREVSRISGKRFVLFIENINQLLDDNLDSKMKATLRRLLMTDPFMMIVGSTVQMFESLRRYDEAFFNYFGPVPLGRLAADQVTDLLKKRAEFDRNEAFLRELPDHQAKIRTLVQLTGGNPRFILMLYELLSMRGLSTTIQYLRRLVDELTPLLKDEMENLAPQQRKIVHAIMEKGGTAQPAELAKLTRLPLNAITSQLKRLKESQIVCVLDGGKGRTANYTIPDKLFSIWYQMRYLSQNRRRIELFVEVLRVWFEVEQRVRTMRELLRPDSNPRANNIHESATLAEYFAASLRGTVHEKTAAELCITTWAKTDINQAAIAHADFVASASTEETDNEKSVSFAMWLLQHDMGSQAIEALERLLRQSTLENSTRESALYLLGLALSIEKDFKSSVQVLTTLLSLPNIQTYRRSPAHLVRGSASSFLGDYTIALDDFNVVLADQSAIERDKTESLMARARIFRKQSNIPAAIREYDKVLEVTQDSAARAKALIQRAIGHSNLRDYFSAVRDYTSVINLEGGPDEERATAFARRGAIEFAQEAKKADALDDFEAALKFREIPAFEKGLALYCKATIALSEQRPHDAVSLYLEIVDTNVDMEIFPQAAVSAISTSLAFDEKVATDGVKRVGTALNSRDKELSRRLLLGLFSCFGSLASRSDWLFTWNILADVLKKEVLQDVSFVNLITKYLETNDSGILNSLPPEQRDFAQVVINTFEDSEKIEKT